MNGFKKVVLFLKFMINKIRDEKLEYDIGKEAAKISALSSGKSDKYEYLTGETYCLLIKDK